jgi:pimeloyl-ACP methyl ester carboxylesterase
MFKMKQLHFLFLLILSVGIFSFSSHVQATTIVASDISENTTWTLADSPYVLGNSVNIFPDATLTIKPGVIVKIDGAWNRIYVLGSIVANGTASMPITFTSFQDDLGGDTNGDGESFPFEGDWYGIYVNDPTGGSYFSNTIINYSDSGLTFKNTPSVLISNLAVNYFNYDGLTLFNNSHAIVNGFSSDGGDDNIAIFNNSSGEFTNVLIKNSGCYESVFVANDSTLSITGGSIKDSFGDGIFFVNHSIISINHVTLDNLFGSAILDFGNYNSTNYLPSSLDVSNSIIKNNIVGFESWALATTFSASHNSIFDNLDYGVLNNYSDFAYNFENTWWGDSSGPYHETENPGGQGNTISDNVLFKPWCQSENCETGNSSVLFLPGIEASRLYKQKIVLGLPVEDQLWEPNENSDVEDLYLNLDGTSIDPNIYTRDIIKESNTPFPVGSLGLNVYKSFSNMMDGLVNDGKIAEWKPFAYDWRAGVDDIVNNGTNYENGNVSLVATLQALVDSSQNGKVTIVAHSNGGLLAKALLKKLQEDKDAGINNLIDKVDVLILVASPEIGTASAVPAILHGYDQRIVGGWLLDETHAREVGRNMIGALGLLPSKEYLNRVSASPTTFVDNATPSGATTNLVQTFGSAIDSYAEYKNFLFGGEGRTNPLPSETNLPIVLSPNLFAQAENLHDSIDAWTPPTSIRVIEMAGWGLDTVASFEYSPMLNDCSLQNPSCPPTYTLDERPRFTADGDKTVVVPSAQYMSSTGNNNVEKYWINLLKVNIDKPNFDPVINHGNILEINSLLDFISSTIQKLSLDNSPYIKTTVPVDTGNRFRISIHSPVTLDAYDADGNHTGKICPQGSDFCYAEENISNSSYMEFGDGKYINLPEDKVHSVRLQGIDIGTFTYDSEQVLPDGTSTTSSFVYIPVTTQTEAEITLDPNTGTLQLALDVTGDGVTDFVLAPNSVFDPILYLQIMKVTIDSLDLNQGRIISFNNRVDHVIGLIQRGEINQAKLRVEKFKSVLEKKLSKRDKEHPNVKILSKADAQLLLDMLNKLLDNLS